MAKIKKDIANLVAAEHGITISKSTEIVDTITDFIKEAVQGGDKVTVRGFGTFGSKVVKQKIGRDFSTGKQVIIPSRTKIKFFASKSF